MIADAIMDATARRDIVLDGFLGSGSTLIAAERTGRRCFGLELDPLYVDGIVRRWQAFTRNSARIASSGRSFAELEAEEDEDIDEKQRKERTAVRGRIRQAAKTLSLSEGTLRKS
jgi:DNA modification methylase